MFPERDVMLLPYQQRWINDNSRLKLCEKSRQIGLSWCTAYRVVRQKLSKGARLDAFISSRDETSALLFIEDAKRFADVFGVANTPMRLPARAICLQPSAWWTHPASKVLPLCTLPPDDRTPMRLPARAICWQSSAS